MYGIHVAIAAFFLILFSEALYFIWPSEVQLVLWASIQSLYLVVWDAVYLILLICNLVRRRPIFRVVWLTAAFLALVTYVQLHMVFGGLDRCGGWDSFVALVGAPFHEDSWVYKYFTTGNPFY